MVVAEGIGDESAETCVCCPLLVMVVLMVVVVVAVVEASVLDW